MTSPDPHRDINETGSSTSSPLTPGRRLHPLVAAGLGALAVVLVAGVVVGGIKLSDSSGEDPELFTITGTVIVEKSRATSTFDCVGRQDYEDISAGTEVRVRNRSGDVVATGSLSPGTRVTTSSPCMFSFAVVDVPADNDSYELQISERNGPSYTEDEARQPLSWTLE